MSPKRILILGGTAEARALAASLVQAGHDVTTSLAGVTQHPHLPEGQIRIGGFGGAAGLRDFLALKKIDVVVDATHPFAAAISRNAAEACGATKLLRLERPAWIKQTEDIWIGVPDTSSAAQALPQRARVLLTIGRKEIGVFMARTDLTGVARMIEPPPAPLSAQWQLMLKRPPFSLESEIGLMRSHAITHLVCKNAGGVETYEKLLAARQLRIAVVMINRPTKPVAPIYKTVEALAWQVGTMSLD